MHPCKTKPSRRRIYGWLTIRPCWYLGTSKVRDWSYYEDQNSLTSIGSDAPRICLTLIEELIETGLLMLWIWNTLVKPLALLKLLLKGVECGITVQEVRVREHQDLDTQKADPSAVTSVTLKASMGFEAIAAPS